MPRNFSLITPPRILFGPGKLAELRTLLPEFGSRPLLVLGKSFAGGGHFEGLAAMLADLALPYSVVEVSGEPSPQLINSIVADMRHGGCDMVLAIGGGSVLDAGKAVAAMMVEGGEVERFLEGVGTMAPSGRKLPFLAVPTTAGTGSEATANAVLSRVGPGGYKKSLRHPRYCPEVALVDPQLTSSCPESLTMACAMDCLSQLVEGYLSTQTSPLTDSLAREGVTAAVGGLKAIMQGNIDLETRCQLSYAALLSGIVLANAGLGTVHGLAGAIGGIVAIPHGVVCGRLLAPCNRLTLNKLRTTAPQHAALAKYTELGRLSSGRDGCDANWYQDAFIAFLEELAGHPALNSFTAYGMRQADVAAILGESSNKNNPLPLEVDEQRTILRSQLA
jgi:alcohol dehydrogenase class IV